VASAESLEELLEQVRNVRSSVDAQFKQRATSYNGAAPGEQARLLGEAQAKRAALAAKADELASAYSANEVRINEINKQMREKAQSLGLQEVFGLAKQTAGDAATILEQSLISTQFPPAQGEQSRDVFLRGLSSSQKALTTPELQRLWFELHREMTASGQVAKYPLKVVQPGGEAVDSTVIRVGPFTASADGKYLSYLPALKTLNVYPRQPPKNIMGFLSGLQNPSGGYAKAIVDSSRGVLMNLYVERPTWVKRIQNGEHINYVILLVGLLGLLAFFWQLIHLVLVRSKVRSQLRNLDNLRTDNPLGRVLLAFKGDPAMIEQEADVAELRISEAVLKETPRLERFQPFLRLSVAAGPLLGLIGTVVGMIITFQSITESGSSDPKLMANGIGIAMIATVLGLGIAIPLLFANALLNSLSRSVTQVLDEQSVGMLAESIERKGRRA
jgi:biopolymer transport protein ExbB